MSDKDEVEDGDIIDDIVGEYVEIFRLISGQVIVARLESPLVDIIESGCDSFVTHDPTELTYEPIMDEMGDIVDTEMFFSDYLGEFDAESAKVKVDHVMIHSNGPSKYIEDSYLDYLEVLYHNREERRERDRYLAEEQQPVVYSENNRELYEEILQSIDNEDKSHNIH